MKTLLHWLGNRTGLGRPVSAFLFDPIPGGARWRHTWSSLVVFVFLVQVITGWFLLTGYSASTQTAWESVHYLQEHTTWGWLLRGMHAISAQAFVVLLALHVLQMVIRRAYVAPRELNFLLLLVLLVLAVKISVAGWFLPFDQKGFWAARVPLNLISLVPVIGPWAQRVVLGGPEVTHLTLTRMVAFHTVYLPAIIGLLIALYFVVTHRHRNAIPAPAHDGDQPWWPHQALRDAVACAAVTAVVLLIVFRPWSTEAARGVELMAPADPSELYPAARPEWFMLWLFEFLKLFPGEREFIGAIVIPGAALLLLALMPWLGRWRLGHAFNVAFVGILFVGAVGLGVRAWHKDRQNPEHQQHRARARALADRAEQLAGSPMGIPPEGALSLLRHDPLTQGPRLFAQHCASCHRFDGHNGLGVVSSEEPSASDLKGFGSREWITGLLDPERVATPHYFGGTAFSNRKMVKYVQRDLADLDPDEKLLLPKVVAALSAEAALSAQREVDARDAGLIEEGRELIRSETFWCTDCHQFRQPDEDATAPDLTGYASREWLLAFVRNPAHPRFYGDRNDRMPAYGEDRILTETELGLVVDWLRGDWYEADSPTAE